MKKKKKPSSLEPLNKILLLAQLNLLEEEQTLFVEMKTLKKMEEYKLF
jgi:hypothetical protein